MPLLVEPWDVDEIKEAKLFGPSSEGSSFVELYWLQDRQQSKPPSKIAVYRDEDILVGWAGVGTWTFKKKENLPSSVNMLGTYVKPEYRTQGIGRKLVQKALANLAVDNKYVIYGAADAPWIKQEIEKANLLPLRWGHAEDFKSKVQAKYTPARKVKIDDFKKLPKLVNTPGWTKDYFLTGGCWGMALAVYDFLKKQGYSPKLKINYGAGTIHAYVEVKGKGIDATGVFDAASKEWEDDFTYSVKEFKEIARDYGPPSVPEDKKSADGILEDL